MTADDDDIKNYAVNHCYCYSLIDWVLILFTTTRLELNSKSKATTRCKYGIFGWYLGLFSY